MGEFKIDVDVWITIRNNLTIMTTTTEINKTRQTHNEQFITNKNAL